MNLLIIGLGVVVGIGFAELAMIGPVWLLTREKVHDNGVMNKQSYDMEDKGK